MMKTKKMVVLLLALCLILGGAIGGTIAYLMDKTAPVVNTFTTSDVSIELKETVPANNTEKMVPGKVIAKDPKVTVSVDSEDCYLFVKIEKSANFDNYLTFAIANGWTALPGVSNVYYIDIDTAAEKGVAISILAGDKVTVLPTVTKDAMETAEAANPTLSFTAYAIQKNYLVKGNVEINTAEQAWTLIDK